MDSPTGNLHQVELPELRDLGHQDEAATHYQERTGHEPSRIKSIKHRANEDGNHRRQQGAQGHCASESTSAPSKLFGHGLEEDAENGKGLRAMGEAAHCNDAYDYPSVENPRLTARITLLAQGVLSRGVRKI